MKKSCLITRFACFLILASACTAFSAESGRVIKGTPGNCANLVKNLKPGDTLSLEPGTYERGLRISNLKGTQKKLITIQGPAQGKPASFSNTVRISGSEYVVVRNLEIDGRNRAGAYGIVASNKSHHITIENCIVKNHASTQQCVGICTNGSPTWNWTIRNNIVDTAGTGMYLGNSDGTNPFVNSIIEYNLIMNTIGYNIQVKHQKNRPVIPGMPAKGITIIRHNVFSKAKKPPGRSDGARPNLLVGHFPNQGSGADDQYLIYGNFFYENCTAEALFQGEGNVAFYNNVLYNSTGPAVRIQRHNDRPKMIRIFQNTVVAKGTGISVFGGDGKYKQIVFGNAVFAGNPVRAPQTFDNITGSFNSAVQYLLNPGGGIGIMDFYPKPGKLSKKAFDTKEASLFPDWNLDFNGHPRKGAFRGAYAGEGMNRGWKIKLERKPAKKRFDSLAETGNYTYLTALVNKIIQGKNLGYALKEIRVKLKDPDKEIVKEAQELYKAVGGYAEELMKAASDLKESDPAAAMVKYEEIAELFAGDEIAVQAKKEVRALARHPKVKQEKQAQYIWKQILAYSTKLKPYNGARDPGSPEFRRLNRRSIQVLVNECRKLLQRYPDTSVAPAVKSFMDSYTK